MFKTSICSPRVRHDGLIIFSMPLKRHLAIQISTGRWVISSIFYGFLSFPLPSSPLDLPQFFVRGSASLGYRFCGAVYLHAPRSTFSGSSENSISIILMIVMYERSCWANARSRGAILDWDWIKKSHMGEHDILSFCHFKFHSKFRSSSRIYESYISDALL